MAWEYHARLCEIEKTNAPCKLECGETYDRELGDAFNRFASRVSRVPFSGSHLGEVTALVDESRHLGQLLFAAAESKTDAEHRAALDAIQPLVDAFVSDAEVLGPAPDNGIIR